MNKKRDVGKGRNPEISDESKGVGVGGVVG